MYKDYYKAFAQASAVLQTYESIPTFDMIKEVQDNFSSLIVQEITNLKNCNETGEDCLFFSNSLLKSFGVFSDTLKLTEEVLHELSSLRNNLEMNLYYKHTQRQLLAVIDGNNLEEIHNFMIVSESIILSSNDIHKIEQEKKKLKILVKQYMEKVCEDVWKENNQVQIKLRLTIFEVEKLNLKMRNKFYLIPLENNDWTVLAKIKMESSVFNSLDVNQKYCVAKAAFRANVTEKRVSFMVHIVNSQLNEIENFENATITVFLPQPKEQNNKYFVRI